ncbi:phenylalanine--tRNA ligase subunit beta [Nosocomiicoccus ampullae]|uniref:Phenylalanine--tRNA ligase beta subunit n=1 Tax=Nosocomiicoccus ampullae TaxID=489910 RepID=A0A9Q2HEG8_9STAP|nr:phenylalanine--tRNA ligase subunit beta [Nosocomiicoccus ampullae]MBB5175313.1 phenylalanyl-tRNA synthetase beta chain [Nosocomiicoccus ampullae]QYA46314.1 phenylalanine--tRNA ligase subunit beta [Nosocomiicoccus ampullae]
MKVSKEWLDQFIPLDVSKHELSETITRSGIEVDDIIDYTETVKDVVVGYVKECDKHPDADKLNVTKVDIGDDTVQIVCGAPNIQADTYVIVAKVGGEIPGLKLRKAKLRGVESEGMICSLEELGIPKDLSPKEFEDGIFIFTETDNIAPGQNALEALYLNDYVLEYDLTPNRKDALSMIGSAYEARALFGGEVTEPDQSFNETSDTSLLSVSIDDEESVQYYGARIVKNVTIKPSPLWMQIRLIKAGIRPINNVVDISNYVLLEFGQPIHMFDYDKIGSTKIVTRHAKNGEKMTTLDGKERELLDTDIVVTNGKEPVALAGVMGGDFSEVKNDTKNVVIESALFDPVSIRKTASRLNLRSEASQRFEKGVSHVFVLKALNRAAHLLEKYAGGEVEAQLLSDGTLNLEDTIIHTSVSFLNKRLGLELSSKEVKDILEHLGIKAEGDDELTCYIPSRRDDLKIQEDISEEVARIYGYDNIPSTLPKYSKITPGQLTDAQVKTRSMRELLMSNGFSQAINYALTSEENIGKFTTLNEGLKLNMPMSEMHSVLRTSLIPHLVDNAVYNKNRMQERIELFEIGNIFKTNGQTELPDEIQKLAVLSTGKVNDTKWLNTSHEPDFYHIKGIIEAIFTEFNLLKDVRFEATTDYEELHPGRSAHIYLNDVNIGVIGELHPTYSKAHDLGQTTVAEIDLEHVLDKSESIIYEPIVKFPSISRDVALEVPRDVTSQSIIDLIWSLRPNYLVEVYPFDVYEGEHIDNDKKSIALHLIYQNKEDTLKDSDVKEAHEPVLERFEEEGFTIRE